jgi:hypothetical protein
MSQPKDDDSHLSEVKAVLGRLQRISRNPHAAGAEIAADSSPKPEPASAEAGSSVLPVGIASLVARVNASHWRVKAAVLIGPVLAVAVGVAIFAGVAAQRDKEPAPPVASLQNPVQTSASPRTSASPQDAARSAAASLHVASELMASGQVRAAREVLLRVTKEESADVAWTLARSYDPNFLITIQAADAAPDVPEATRWYRAWYDIAVKQGLVADSVPLDRIIRSMNPN